jgi:hypothetical protein
VATSGLGAGVEPGRVSLVDCEGSVGSLILTVLFGSALGVAMAVGLQNRIVHERARPWLL